MNGVLRNELTLGQCATLACLLEVAAPKPGNVHRGADFASTSFYDFVVSAAVIGPHFDNAANLRVGALVLESALRTRAWVGQNTNLGLLLLLAPLAKAAAHETISRTSLEHVLQSLTPADAADVYEAIRVAQPGGLGDVASGDVAGTPPVCLRAAMRQASQRDLIARQYANGFEELMDEVVPDLKQRLQAGEAIIDAIVHGFVKTLSRYPDSLISRKCGPETAAQAAALASHALRELESDEGEFAGAMNQFDFWLRSDGNRRNPGTTADMLGAAVFVCLHEGLIQYPFTGSQ